MRMIKSILTLLAGIAILAVLVSLFLPSEIHVERTALVKSSPAVVYKLICSLPEWEKWSPWHRRDPGMKLKYGDLKEGKGAWYSWESDHPNVGSGKMTITDARAADYIKTEMDFLENGKGRAEFYLRPADGGTEVKWTMDTDVGMNPVGRIFGLFMDKMVGADYEIGLRLMDSVARTLPAEPYTMDLEMGRSPEMKILFIRREVPEAGLSQALGECYGKITVAIGKLGLEISGAPLAFYEDPKDGLYRLEAAIPVKALPPGKSDGEVEWKDVPGGAAAICHFSGPYHLTQHAYPALSGFIEKNGKKAASLPYESYLTDPSTAKHSLEIKTDIIWPVK
jgi:effector-binding domain-containing protein